jgi:hypothetical protein
MAPNCVTALYISHGVKGINGNPLLNVASANI